ncbi:MAG: hypothetical protein R3A48_02380 [Polyangiales bacterium]
MSTRRLALSLLALGCGSSTPPAADAGADVSADVAVDAPLPDLPAADAGGPRDYAWVEPPSTVVVEPGVRRDAFLVDAPPPPPNPTTNTPTPAQYNRVQVLRYRVDATPARAARAVIVAMPGFLGGAGSFDALARAVVSRSATGEGPVEVWAIDRRSNLLEDLRGMHTAERLGDNEIAAAYYNDREATVGGQGFSDFPAANDPALAFMSEWGLATTVNDLRAVVARVPDSRQHVILLGHSLGASIVEAYAAWDFDGVAGYRSIAGIALVDGVAGGAPAREDAWRTGASTGIPGVGSVGVDALRASGPRYFALPLLGVRALVISEIVARRALAQPDAVVEDRARDSVLRLLLGVSPLPDISNAAALGLAFDDRSCPLAFARMSCGAPVGGAVETRANAFAPGETVTVPSDSSATYRWTDAPATQPREFTSIRANARAWSATPSNFSEWFFPSRLPTDVAALGDMRLAPDSWQVQNGIRAMHGGEIDVPVLGIATALVGRADAFDRVRDRVAPTLGMDLPNAGAARAQPEAFRASFVPGMTHLDPITGDGDNPANPVPGDVLAFATRATRGSTTPTP